MKRNDLTKRIADQTRTSPAEAADGLDRVVHDLIRKLRRGRRASLPGLGELGSADRKPRSKGGEA